MSPPSGSQQRAGTAKGYVPALGYHGLTGLYDRVVAVTMREAIWRADFVRLIAPSAEYRLACRGAGTG